MLEYISSSSSRAIPSSFKDVEGRLHAKGNDTYEGNDLYRELPVPFPFSSIASIEKFVNHSAVILKNGEVWTTNNREGRFLLVVTPFKAIAIYYVGYYMYIISTEGRLYATKDYVSFSLLSITELVKSITKECYYYNAINIDEDKWLINCYTNSVSKW